jgi:hypothetical protein
MSPGTPILGALLTPALFYGGAAAVGAPILIHLLARRRFKRIRWAAMEFLIDAERRNRRRIRMEDWILMALRCLGVFLIGLLLARPFVKPAGLAAAFGGAQRTERVFVLDDSYSMAFRGPDGTPFDRVKEAVRRVVATVRRETPNDTVTLLRMSELSEPIESGTFLDETQTARLLERLEALAPTQGTIDPPAVIEGVADVLKRAPGVTNAAVYILSDFRRSDWARDDADGSADAKSGGVLEPLLDWAQDGRGLRTVLIDLGDDDAPNTAVTRLEIPSGPIVAGTASVVRAGVANFADGPRENLELQVTVGNLAQPSKTVRRLEPQQRADVELEVAFFQPGYEALRVELPPDALPVDNVRYLATEIVSAIRVLIVDGEASSDAYDDEVTFLATALRPEGELISGNEPVVVDETQLDETKLEQFHLVVLANVYRISDPTIEALERFVRGGGGLMVFLGDQVDADLYNGTLYKSGAGLLPVELTQIVRPSGASHLVVVDRLHPSLRGLAAEGDPLGLGHVPFFEYFGSRLVGMDEAGAEDTGSAGSEVTGADAGDGRSRQGAARVLARFDDPEETPAMIERRFGRGQVILITTSADKEWNFWPDHPTFLPVLLELTQGLAKPAALNTERLVGERIDLRVDPAEFAPDLMLRTPGYPNVQEVSVAAQPSEEAGGLVAAWEQTGESGIYQFVLRRIDGGESVRMVAVNVDPRESDLTPADETQLRAAMGDAPFDYVKGLDAVSGAAGEARTELWRLVLIAAALVLMYEQGLAWMWGKRR